MPCKHMFAVFKYCTECSWDSLPETYKQSEYLSADTAMLSELSVTKLESLKEFDTAIEKPPEEFDTAIEKPEFMSVHREESTCTSEIPTKVNA